MVKNFENLRVWRESMDFVDEVYFVVIKFPRDEIYGLTSQLKRAVVSIPSNISEGCGKRTDKDFSRYLYNAIGSVKEVKCQLMIARRLGFLEKEKSVGMIDVADKLSGMLINLIKKILGEKNEV